MKIKNKKIKFQTSFHGNVVMSIKQIFLNQSLNAVLSMNIFQLIKNIFILLRTHIHFIFILIILCFFFYHSTNYKIIRFTFNNLFAFSISYKMILSCSFFSVLSPSFSSIKNHHRRDMKLNFGIKLKAHNIQIHLYGVFFLKNASKTF